MRQALTALLAMTCLLLSIVAAVDAQGGPNTASVGFHNRSDVNVIVIGYTIVNGSKKGGPTLQLKKTGGKGFESNVPPGIRYYTIHDANNPVTILGRHQVLVNRDVTFDIVRNPDTKMLTIVPAVAAP